MTRCRRCWAVIYQSPNHTWRATMGWFPGVCDQGTFSRHEPLTRADVIRGLVDIIGHGDLDDLRPSH